MASTVIWLPTVGPDDVDDGPIGYTPEHPRSVARTADPETLRRIRNARRAAEADARSVERWRIAGFAGHRYGSPPV